jgi:hypothetical protein
MKDTATIYFTVEVEVEEETLRSNTPSMLADDLLDYLTDGGDGLVEFPAWIDSVVDVEPVRGEEEE